MPKESISNFQDVKKSSSGTERKHQETGVIS